VNLLIRRCLEPDSIALMKPAAVVMDAEREAEDDDDVIRSITNRAYISINTVKTFLKI
jgi:hypothetical protein